MLHLSFIYAVYTIPDTHTHAYSHARVELTNTLASNNQFSWFFAYARINSLGIKLAKSKTNGDKVLLLMMAILLLLLLLFLLLVSPLSHILCNYIISYSFFTHQTFEAFLNPSCIVLLLLVFLVLLLHIINNVILF